MEKLIEILKEETKTLKTQYVAKIVEWSKIEFDTLMEKKNWTKEEWGVYLGVETYVNENHGNPVTCFERGFHNRIESRTYSKEFDLIHKVTRGGLEKHLINSEKKAIEHYNKSIEKLANRIQKKGLDTNKLKAESSHIGVNFETTLTDGDKKVKAFTIIASGVVQRPHYRYLIK